MENNKVKVWFLKLVVSLGSVLIIYTIASDLYKIAYFDLNFPELIFSLKVINFPVVSTPLNSR